MIDDSMRPTIFLEIVKAYCPVYEVKFSGPMRTGVAIEMAAEVIWGEKELPADLDLNTLAIQLLNYAFGLDGAELPAWLKD